MLKIFKVLYFERKNNIQLAFPGHSEIYKQQHLKKKKGTRIPVYHPDVSL